MEAWRPMLMPEGMGRASRPRRAWRGTPLRRAMRSSRAFSTVALAISFPRTRRHWASTSPRVRSGFASGRRKAFTRWRAEVVVSPA